MLTLQKPPQQANVRAVSWVSSEVADFLIKAGADIELGCSTPLMEASQEGHLELVKYLLAAGMWF